MKSDSPKERIPLPVEMSILWVIASSLISFISIIYAFFRTGDLPGALWQMLMVPIIMFAGTVMGLVSRDSFYDDKTKLAILALFLVAAGLITVGARLRKYLFGKGMVIAGFWVLFVAGVLGIGPA